LWTLLALISANGQIRIGEMKRFRKAAAFRFWRPLDSVPSFAQCGTMAMNDRTISLTLLRGRDALNATALFAMFEKMCGRTPTDQEREECRAILERHLTKSA
jgi:hypothetical protein